MGEGEIIIRRDVWLGYNAKTPNTKHQNVKYIFTTLLFMIMKLYVNDDG